MKRKNYKHPDNYVQKDKEYTRKSNSGDGARDRMQNILRNKALIDRFINYYTEEDLKAFDGLWKSHHPSYSKSPFDPNNREYSTPYISGNGFISYKALMVDMEDVPLYLGKLDKYTKGIALYRLQVCR